MSNIAIRVEGLSKQYRIGGKTEQYRTLRETLTDIAASPFRAISSVFRATDVQGSNGNNKIWALRDLNFEVGRGEVIGVIGRNGAGKSTLLKILSRITEPTSGEAEIRGRVGSLLEVGTGFHPELTGRENIYLNGAILGMKQGEIRRKFEDIVAFAEVDQFIDTPVKHYSSGMYLRLAFAVAAHLEPEILMVDEVLAVGDAAFQKKCLGKMGDVAQHGRTVLFVSHSMGAILSLCSRVLVVEQGRIVFDDVPNVAVAGYLKGISGNSSLPIGDRIDREGNQKLRFARLTILDRFEQAADTLPAGDDVTIELDYELADGTIKDVAFAINFLDSFGRILFQCLTRTVNSTYREITHNGKVRCVVPNLPLAPGTYSLTVVCKENGYTLADKVDGAGEITITSGDFFGTGKVTPQDAGPFMVKHSWELVPVDGTRSSVLDGPDRANAPRLSTPQLQAQAVD
jgi:homopolymeric O-antigen transport system ATP-binding protein